MRLKGKNPLLILINNEFHSVKFNISNVWKKELSTAKIDGFNLPPHSLAVFTK